MSFMLSDSFQTKGTDPGDVFSHHGLSISETCRVMLSVEHIYRFWSLSQLKTDACNLQTNKIF